MSPVYERDLSRTVQSETAPQLSRQGLFRFWNLTGSSVDVQAQTTADSHHFIGPGRGASYSQDGVTFLQKSNRDGMEHLS